METKHIEILKKTLGLKIDEALEETIDAIVSILEDKADENQPAENQTIKTKMTIPAKIVLEYNSAAGIAGKVVIDAKRIDKVSGVAEFEIPFDGQEELPGIPAN